MQSQRYYSPRRYYRRRYNGNYRSRKYNPSMNLYQRPLDYQQIGRTLQSRPNTICQPLVNGLITPKKMDEMYKILQDNYYPAIQKPIPIDVQPFFIQMERFTRINELFIQDGEYVDVNPQRFYNGVSNYLNTTNPGLFQRYNQWRFQLYYLYVFNDHVLAALTNVQFTIQWVNNLLTQQTPYALVYKTLDTGIAATTSSPTAYVSPSNNNTCSIARLSLTNSGTFTRGVSTVQTNDGDISDNGFYPIIDTAASNQDINYGVLQFVSEAPVTTNDYNYVGLGLSVLCIPIVN